VRRALVGTLLPLVLGSCTLLEQVQRIGVSTGPDGSGLLVHHQPCEDETLTGITLSVGDPEEGGTVIWQVAGTATGGPYEVGTTPPGMTESVAFTHPPGDAGLHLEIATQDGALTRTSSLSFSQADLPSDRVFTLGGTKDPETFRRDALETCEEG
jgi:hypothetical protein